uniref:Uncharacterized protein n=1 Tax=Arundo donax TaxID=35708 RepID=A0A0A8ZU81_ARUDO
MYKGKAKVVQ